MQVPIFQINVNAGRREADPEAVQKLADSISKVGLLNPITVDQEYTLIAGLHRLEAAKRLGWSEIECTVSSLDGLLAELAEDGDTAYGLIDLGLGMPELGHVRLSDLASIVGPNGIPVRVDPHFKAQRTLSAYAADAARDGSIND